MYQIPWPLKTTKADAAGLIHMAEQGASARSAQSEPVFNCLPCSVRHIYQPVFAAFAAEHGEFVHVLFVMGAVKVHDLRAA